MINNEWFYYFLAACLVIVMINSLYSTYITKKHMEKVEKIMREE